jgi:hypothetical protein
VDGESWYDLKDWLNDYYKKLVPEPDWTKKKCMTTAIQQATIKIILKHMEEVQERVE